MPKQDRIVARAAHRGREAVGIILIAGAIIWFYGYFATSHSATPFQFDRGPSDYYHYLVDGFLHGHLSLMVKPPPQLATLPDPYDPMARMRIGQPGWADMSYYHGRYYLYFGVAPALTLFLPFKLLTGLYFPEFLACVVFCAVGYLASLALFLAWRRRFFPECSSGMIWLGTLMLGLGNFAVVMLSRSQFYEVPIASAYGFSCVGLLLLYYALFEAPRRRIWLWLASGAFGLAIASRPHFVFASVVLGLAGIPLWRDRSASRAPGWRRQLGWDAVAATLPVALMVIGLFVYNYERFDSPFNFGQKLQLSGSDQMHMTLVAWSSIPINLYYYFLAPAHFSRYFPFFDIIGPYPGKTPAIYYGIEDPFGVLTNMPCFWLALVAPVLWLASYRRNRVLGWMLLLCGACFGTVCLFTLFFVSATNRYMVDFLPALLLIAAMGLLMVSVAAPRFPVGRRLLKAGAGLLILYTAFFNAMAAFQHNGLFQHLQPAAYDRIGRWFNYPPGIWDRLTRVPFGPAELTVKFSRQDLGRTEPLLVTGTAAGHSDIIYVYYVGDGSVQIGFAHMGAGMESVTSQPIAVDYDAPHRIGIEAGSLYPVRTHPYFSDWPKAAIDAAKETLRVTVDGVPYLDAREPFYDAPPGSIFFGENPLSEYAGRKFTGSWLDVRRRPPPPAIEPFPGGGFVRVAFVPPTDRAGTREPLIATGAPGAGDLLFVSYDDAAHLRLGFLHAGAAPVFSAPLAVVAGQIQVLDASLGSFYAGASRDSDLTRALVAKFNNQLIWAQPQTFFPATVPVLGRDSWHSQNGASEFTGRIVAVHPIPSPLAAATAGPFRFQPYWLERGQAPAYGALRLHVTLPRNQIGHFEPLLVSGPSVSQADYVWIQYVDAARVQIGYEHTSGGGPASGAIAVDYSRPHVVALDLPSLYPHQDSPYFSDWPLLTAFASKTHGQIRLDGVVRIDGSLKAYESTPAQATPGENRLSTTFGQRFTGQIIEMERAVHGPPPGFTEQTGPLEMTVVWPDMIPVGRQEPLLATGRGDSQDTLFVSYDDVKSAHWVVRMHDGKVFKGVPFSITGGRASVLKAGWGGFFADKARPATEPVTEWAARRGAFAIEVDGYPVFSGKAGFVLADPQGVAIGSGNDPAAAFSGIIRDVRRLPARSP